MTAIFVEVTAEQIAACVTAPDSDGFDPAWATPLEMAIEKLTGEAASIDGDGPGKHIATIGSGDWTIVLNLPAEANAWLDARWNGDEPAGPETFRIEVADWIRNLVVGEAIEG